jgi:hypothetical protein
MLAANRRSQSPAQLLLFRIGKRAGRSRTRQACETVRRKPYRAIRTNGRSGPFEGEPLSSPFPMPCLVFSVRIAQIICSFAVRLARRDRADGIVDFISENCIGCGHRVTGCAFNIPADQSGRTQSYKRTLCSDRAGVGPEPARAEACPTGAYDLATLGLLVAEAGAETRATRCCSFGFG